MSEAKAAKPTQAKTPAEEKKGFFSRIVNKLDGVMKDKADQKSKQSCCGSDGKGDKCC